MTKQNIFLVTLLVIADQIIKLLVVLHLDTPIEVISNFFTLKYVKNFGISFSMLNNKNIFIVLVSLVAVYLIYKLIIEYGHVIYLKLPLLFMLGGAIGNLLDRIVRGFVVDYIALNFGSYNFAVFNLADMFLVVGCIAMFIGLIIYEKGGLNA